MLRFLSIRHLALIEELELELEPGLTVLTGETGAGKSMLVGALGLLVGGRASADLVRTGQDTATVEAAFEDPHGAEIIVRREVSAQSGRSRAYLNGALVPATALRDAGTSLVDLHGQHEHQRLLDPSTHLDLLDTFGGLMPDRARVGAAFGRWRALRAERDRLASADADQGRRAEFLQFQISEIARAAPRAGEDEELAATRRVLANAGRLQRLCADAYAELYEGDASALAALARVWKKVGELAALDDRFAGYAASREAVKPQLEDLAYFLRSYAAGIDSSPARLQEVEDRLAALERLKKKHGPTLNEVLGAAARMEQELASLENAAARATTLEAELQDAGRAYSAEAGSLAARRRAAAAEFAERLQRSLAELAMPRTRCDVRFAPPGGEDTWTERGADDAEIYISPNVGEDLRPLARIASGGELSRIMLAVKTLASTDAAGKTLVFDEVDAGIGGAVADIVGARLRALGRRYQVLCITHLPQIAACGGTHYHLSKTVKGSRTVTTARRLGVREREAELARMIAGAEVSPAVRTSAREMLARNAQGESE